MSWGSLMLSRDVFRALVRTTVRKSLTLSVNRLKEEKTDHLTAVQPSITTCEVQAVICT